MVRTMMVILLLAVFFLSGAVYGMNQNSEGDTNRVDEQEITETLAPEKTEVEVSEPTPIVDQDLMATGNEVHLTQKTASFLETSIQGFYGIVVGILSQIAELFF